MSWKTSSTGSSPTSSVSPLPSPSSVPFCLVFCTDCHLYFLFWWVWSSAPSPHYHQQQPPQKPGKSPFRTCTTASPLIPPPNPSCTDLKNSHFCRRISKRLDGRWILRFRRAWGGRMMKGICLEEQRGGGRGKVPEGEGRQWVEDRRRPRRTEGCVLEGCISRGVRRKGQTSPSSSCRRGRVGSSRLAHRGREARADVGVVRGFDMMYFTT